MDSSRKQIWGKVPLWVLTIKGLSKNDLRVYVALTSYVGNHTKCYPGLKEIERRSGVPMRHISAHTSRLEDFGLIKKIRRGKRVSNVYSIVSDPQETWESLTDGKVTNGAEDHDYQETVEVDSPETGNLNHKKLGNPILKDHLKEQEKEQTRVMNGYYELSESTKDKNARNVFREKHREMMWRAKVEPIANRLRSVLGVHLISICQRRQSTRI
jgi:DNA-binding transcriptional ArsR family regulator